MIMIRNRILVMFRAKSIAIDVRITLILVTGLMLGTDRVSMSRR